MILEMKKHWKIDQESIKELENQSPFSKSKFYIINDKFFLKEEENNKAKQRELKFNELLSDNNIFILRTSKEVIIENNHIYQLFDYLPQTSEITPQQLSTELSKLKKINTQSIKHLDKESIQFTLNNLKCNLKCHSEKFPIIKKTYDHLEKNLFPFLKYFNYNLSHGDLHPRNILSNKNQISIIDWELINIREELYDLAFYIGCLGIEDPMKLTDIEELLNTFTNLAQPTKLSVTLLPELVLATRLKWLNKWILIKTDQNIIQMEVDLIEMILENIDKLRNLWLNNSNTDFKYSKNNWVLQDSMLVEDINKAKERLSNINIFNHEPNDLSQFATDLRLLAIDHGSKDNIIEVIEILELIEEKQLNHQDNTPLLIERVIAMGNSCLDFSKFRLKNALDYTKQTIKKIKDQNNIPELNIGYSFVLRNTSIAYAEMNQLNTAIDNVEELIQLSENNDDIEIKGELGRALSNIITTLLENKQKQQTTKYFNLLEKLYNQNKTSRKINGAYQVAKANLAK
jgi:hypothetical protein